MVRADFSASRPITARRMTAHHAEHARGLVTHDVAVLGFYVGGSARLEQAGEWSLEPGDVLVVPAGQPHAMRSAEHADLWGASVCVPCLASDGGAELLDPFERVRDGASPVVRIAPERRAYLATLFEELSRIPASGEPAVERSLLTLIVREVARAGQASGSGEPSAVTAALRFIERSCLGPLSLEDVAEAVGRTPSYVTTALTRATGKSAGAWIIAGRMAEARRRLLHSDEPIALIAEKVGYADPTHFIRLFRRTHGVTPAAWRARERGAVASP